MRENTVYIIGAGGHAKIIADICSYHSIEIKGYISCRKEENAYLDDSVLEDFSFVQGNQFIVAIGDQRRRYDLLQKVHCRGGALPNLIHPSVIISKNVALGFANILCAGVFIGPASRIGNGCILNTGVQIDHDCILEDGVHLAPGTILAGSVQCGMQTFVGAGSIIINNKKMGKNCIIGAGSVVIEDIPDRSTAFGNPCKVR